MIYKMISHILIRRASLPINSKICVLHYPYLASCISVILVLKCSSFVQDIKYVVNLYLLMFFCLTVWFVKSFAFIMLLLLCIMSFAQEKFVFSRILLVDHGLPPPLHILLRNKKGKVFFPISSISGGFKTSTPDLTQRSSYFLYLNIT